MPTPRGLVQQIDQRLHRSQLLPRGACLLVAVSGGADSVALLRLLCDINRSDYWQWTLIVGHVDHGIRGHASANDAKFVQHLAQELGLTCRIGRLKLGKHASELDARTGRLNALAAMNAALQRKKLPCHAVVMAHHADDQAETVLMRIFRGCGIDGLASMAPASKVGGEGMLKILRPLLDVRRDELRSYLNTLGQAWREDQTNTSPRYLRNRVRGELFPLIDKIWPQAVPALCRLARGAAESQAVVTAESDRLLVSAQQVSKRAVALPRDALRRALPAVATDALRRTLQSIGGTVEIADFERLHAALHMIRGTAGGKRIDLGRGIVMTLHGNRIDVTRRVAARRPGRVPRPRTKRRGPA